MKRTTESATTFFTVNRRRVPRGILSLWELNRKASPKSRLPGNVLPYHYTYTKKESHHGKTRSKNCYDRLRHDQHRHIRENRKTFPRRENRGKPETRHNPGLRPSRR